MLSKRCNAKINCNTHNKRNTSIAVKKWNCTECGKDAKTERTEVKTPQEILMKNGEYN